MFFPSYLSILPNISTGYLLKYLALRLTPGRLIGGASIREGRLFGRGVYKKSLNEREEAFNRNRVVKRHLHYRVHF